MQNDPLRSSNSLKVTVNTRRQPFLEELKKDLSCCYINSSDLEPEDLGPWQFRFVQAQDDPVLIG